MIVQICVGSSCHIKGSHAIVELMKNAMEEHGLEEEIVLAGCFCTGNCSREGVTISVEEEIFSGITVDTFEAFFEKHILEKLKG